MEEKLHRRWVKIGGKKGSIFDGDFHPLLFTPLNLGNLVLKNRITLAPMFLCYGNADGTVSEKILCEKSKGNVQLLATLFIIIYLILWYP